MLMNASGLGLIVMATTLAQQEADPGLIYAHTPYEDAVLAARQHMRWGASGPSELVLIAMDDAGLETVRPLFPDDPSDNSDPAWNPVRQEICFVSTRTETAPASSYENADIWCAARTQGGWSEPRRLPAPVNSEGPEWSPSFDDAGHLYFASARAGGMGAGDIYRAVEDENGLWQADNAGPAINTPGGEWNVGISQDGETLIFEASGRPESFSAPGDLYLSQQVDGVWQPAVALSRLNTGGSDLYARDFGNGLWRFTSAALDAERAASPTVARQSFAPLPPVLAAVSRSTGEVVLLDPETLAERDRFHAGTGPHEIAASDDGRRALVPLLGIYPEPHTEPVTARPPFLTEPSEGAALIDLATGETRTMALPGCDRPHGAAAHPQAHRFWVTCEDVGEVIEIDGESGEILRRFDVGNGVHKVILHPDGTSLITSNPDRGELGLIDLETGTVQTLSTGAQAEGLTLSTDGEAVFIANAGDRTLCRIDLEALTIRWCQPVEGVFPIAVAFHAIAGDVWVARLGASDIAAFDADTGDFRASIDLPSIPLNLALDARNRRLYVSLPRENAVQAINLDTRTLAGRADHIMEVDDLDLIPASAFLAAPDPQSLTPPPAVGPLTVQLLDDGPQPAPAIIYFE
ncbi:PQQ-binding-like beta-propeller repeat protein [Hyphobacterium sp.]|uniref:outer membrane protein assembly factor BamB family protein n=1 Tax=Hyphobacterium sp. TaxID=2004662 RepID=UPI00374A650B